MQSSAAISAAVAGASSPHFLEQNESPRHVSATNSLHQIPRFHREVLIEHSRLRLGDPPAAIDGSVVGPNFLATERR
jgi:hypothetical protein